MTDHTRPTDSIEEVNKWIHQQQDLVAEFNQRFPVAKQFSSIESFRSILQAYCKMYKLTISARGTTFYCLHGLHGTIRKGSDGRSRLQTKGLQKTNCQCHVRINQQSLKIESSYGVHNHPLPYILPDCRHGRTNVYEIQSKILCMIKDEKSVECITHVLRSNNERMSRSTVKELISRVNKLETSLIPPPPCLMSPTLSEVSELSSQSAETANMDMEQKNDVKMDYQRQKSKSGHVENVVEKIATDPLDKQTVISQRVLRTNKVEKPANDQKVDDNKKTVDVTEPMDISTDEKIDSMMDFLLGVCKDDSSKTEDSNNSRIMAPNSTTNSTTGDYSANYLHHITSSYQNLNASNSENQQVMAMVNNDNHGVIILGAGSSDMAMLANNVCNQQDALIAPLFKPTVGIIHQQFPVPMVPPYSNVSMPFQVPVYYTAQQIQATNMHINNPVNNQTAINRMVPALQYYIPQNGMMYSGQYQTTDTHYPAYPYPDYSVNQAFDWNNHY